MSEEISNTGGGESFAELFEAWHWYETKNGRTERNPFPRIKSGTHGQGEIGDYCAAHRTSLENSLHVKPNRAVVDFIFKMMIVGEYDSIFFEIVERTDELLIVAKNNSIIASRWLALLPKSELKKIAAAAG